jgi:hypothetical protein
MPFLKQESVSRLLEDEFVIDFYCSISTTKKSTAEQQYLSRLNIFNIFLNKKLNNLTMYSLVNKIKEEFADSYNSLSKYCSYLRNSSNISNITIKHPILSHWPNYQLRLAKH